jgi:hypothetical protein
MLTSRSVFPGRPSLRLNKKWPHLLPLVQRREQSRNQYRCCSRNGWVSNFEPTCAFIAQLSVVNFRTHSSSFPGGVCSFPEEGVCGLSFLGSLVLMFDPFARNGTAGRLPPSFWNVAVNLHPEMGRTRRRTPLQLDRLPGWSREHSTLIHRRWRHDSRTCRENSGIGSDRIRNVSDRTAQKIKSPYGSQISKLDST